jgi:hypothetical protein
MFIFFDSYDIIIYYNTPEKIPAPLELVTTRRGRCYLSDGISVSPRRVYLDKARPIHEGFILHML